MNRRLAFLSPVLLCAWLAAGPSPAFAQGLIWKLPEDEGAWVRFEGTYRQVEFRPESAEGNEEFGPWIRHLTIKSLGRETAEFRGEQVPARWLEFKVVTGLEKDGTLDPGPVGARIYKVLVPESAILGKAVDENGIPVSYLPIVSGYRKVGDQEPQEMTAGVLQIFPTISLLQHYRQVEPTSDGTEDPEVGLGPIEARQHTATETLETPGSRAVSEAVLWLGDEVPFGLARWTVKYTQEEKEERAPRTDFKPVSETVVEMKAVEAGNGAQSELAVP